MSGLCHNLVLEHVIAPKKKARSHQQSSRCHFPDPGDHPSFCVFASMRLAFWAWLRAVVTTLSRNPGFSLMAAMQCFLLKQISFNLRLRSTSARGYLLKLPVTHGKRGVHRAFGKLRGSSAPGPGGPFAAASLIWGTFLLSPLSEPLPPSPLTDLKTPISGRKEGARAKSLRTVSPSSPQTQRASCGPSFSPVILSGSSTDNKFNYAIKVIFLS